MKPITLLQLIVILFVFVLVLGCSLQFPIVKPGMKKTMGNDSALGTGTENAASPPPSSANTNSNSLPLYRQPSGDDIQVTATVTHPINIFGRNGFAPEIITIQAGDSITWTNRDPEHKEVALTFYEEGTRHFRNSRTIRPAQEETMIFPQKINYTYWTVGYGVKGKIIVD